MSVYIRIVDKLLHFYGYVPVLKGKSLYNIFFFIFYIFSDIESYMSDYETRFRKWLGNKDETHFFNRLLRSLKIVMYDFYVKVRIRIIEETKGIFFFHFI